MGKRFFQSNGLSKAVFLLPIPVDTNRYTLPSGKVFLQDDTLHIIMVARFVEYKNHEMLFLALHDLHNHSNKKFHLSLIGSSGSRRAFLEKRVEELGIAHIVIFLDRVASEDMPRIYENMDILILPSFNEAV
jgi:glycosyltransferase involved in cell wall biosynthesis